MSCDFVSREVIDNVMAAVLWHPYGHHIDVFHGINTFTGTINGKYHEGPEEIAKLLIQMNADAYNARYPTMEDKAVPYPYKWRPKQIDHWQKLKSLQYFLYNCAEGDIDKRPLYKDLEKVLDAYRDFCLSSCAEYKAAKWGA